MKTKERTQNVIRNYDGRINDLRRKIASFETELNKLEEWRNCALTDLREIEAAEKRAMKNGPILPPKILKNGAEVFDVYHVEDDELLVLAHNGREFVTWYVDHNQNAFCGYYFQTYKEAMENFLERISVRR